MKCFRCGLGPRNGVSLFRQNEKGVQGVWACEVHNERPIDPEVERITGIIESTRETKQ